MINNVVLMGRLTAAPELRTTQSGKSFVPFCVAVDRNRTNSDGTRDTDFINCVAFSKTAEFVEKYCTKGTKLVVEGHIQTGSYTNKDGQKVYTNDCNVSKLEFAESKNANQQTERPRPATDADGFMNIPDGIEDLPFK